MNRIEFTNSLKCSPHIEEYFDEFMSCYDLIACYNTLRIDNYNILDNHKILFNVSVTPSQSVDNVKKILDSTILHKYNNTYRIQSMIVDNNINIILQKIRVSG